MDAPRTCLIIPPSPFLLDERVFPFLGILKVAAALERAKYPVEVLDLSGYANYLDVVRDHLTTSDATHFGITATTPQLPAAVQVARVLRERRPQGRIILGGTHATLVVASYKSDTKRGRVGRAHRAMHRLTDTFDVIVAGDGEVAIFEALKPGAPWLVDADDKSSPLRLTNDMLDDSRPPARHLIDLSSYRYTIDGFQATSLVAQLGCPFGCGFCGGRKSPMLRHIRTRTIESIVGEMEFLYRAYRYTGFMFYDDELNVFKSMVALMDAIAKKQQELGVEWRLRGFIKAELFTSEQAAAMYRAGFRWILVGFESGSPRILTNIQKRATLADNTRCVELAHHAGLKVKALMSIGHPGESPETIAQTKAWLMEARPADFDVTIITPYPGTDYYDDADEVSPGVWTYRATTGDALHQEEVDYSREADFYKGRPDDGYVSHVFTDTLAPGISSVSATNSNTTCVHILVSSTTRARRPTCTNIPWVKHRSHLAYYVGHLHDHASFSVEPGKGVFLYASSQIIFLLSRRTIERTGWGRAR